MKRIKTTRKELSVTIDYLSIVFETLRADDIIRELLPFPKSLFQVSPGRVDHKDYTKVYTMGELRIFSDCLPSTDNPTGQGSYLVLPGQGCAWFQSALDTQGSSFGEFFLACIYLVGYDGFHVTRLDIAIDDRNLTPYFTVEQLIKKCEKQEFVSKSRSHRAYKGSRDEEDTGTTLYIGNRKSDVMYRFYEKDKELFHKYYVPPEEVGSWIRTELELRRKTAHMIATYMAESGETLGEIAFGFLESHLRFVVSDPHQEDKGRWDTCRFWNRFLGDVQPLDIRPEQRVSSLYATQDWLEHGGGLPAYKAFQFLKRHDALGDLKDIEAEVDGMRYSKELAQKLVSHLWEIGRSDLIPQVNEDSKKNIA